MFFFGIADPSGCDVHYYATETLSKEEVHKIIDKAIQKGFNEKDTDPECEVFSVLNEHPDIEAYPSEYIRIPEKFDD